MKTFISFLLFLSFHLSFLNAFASMVSIADDLASREEDLVPGVFRSSEKVVAEYISQAQSAEKIVCKTDSEFHRLSAQNIWAEIQAAAKIQKLTTQKFAETCSSLKQNNMGLCQETPMALLNHYKNIQECIYARVEERTPVLTQKLGKRKILSCSSKSNFDVSEAKKFLNENVYYVNPNYATFSFEDIRQLEELDNTLCKVGTKATDLKVTLIGNAFTKCIAPNPIFAKCLKSMCAKIDGSCVTKHKSSCLEKLDDLEKDFAREQINKCYWGEVANPSDLKTKSLNEQCRKGKNFAKLDASINEVKPSIMGTCNRSVRGCIASVNNAFELNQSGSICILNKINSSSSSSGAASK